MNELGEQVLDKVYRTVDSVETFRELSKELSLAEIIAVDSETNSLNVRKGRVIGLSFTTRVGTGWYLPILRYNVKTESLEPIKIGEISNRGVAIKLLERYVVGKKLLFHNASYDVRIIKNDLGVDLLESVYADTAVLVHTIKEDGAFGYGNPFGLKSIAIMHQEELGLNVEEDANKEQKELKESIVANGGEVTKKNFEIYKADLSILAKYAAADTDLTYRIFLLYMKKLEEENLVAFFFDEEVMPIYKEVTIPMENFGVDLDMALLKETDEMITKDLAENKQVVLKSLLKTSEGKNWVIDTSLKEFPPSNKGNWAQRLAKRYDLPLPTSDKTGKYSLSKGTIGELPESPVKSFLVTGELEYLEPNEILRISTDLWKEKNDGDYINIQSPNHMGELIFEYYGEKELSKTGKGQKQFDMDMIEHLSDKYEWAENLRVYNKLLKIKSTYVDRFLEGNEDGRYYFYYKQNGTVSGRYGSDAQQLPKTKEPGEDVELIVHYNNLVRAFLIAGPGRKVIDADYESLEPHCFASVSGDEKLREIFNKNYDFYSTVAIQTEGLTGVSPDKKADNYLKKVDPVKRNQAKAYALGIAYGMSDFALSKTLDITQKEAKLLVDGYLNGFPGLKEWRENSRLFVKEYGFIKNRLGRVRHLDKVKNIYQKFGDRMLDWKFRKHLETKYSKDKILKVYRDYRNGLNNCLNFQLQSLAAGVVNRAAVQINRKAKELGIDAIVQAQVHDQLIINVAEEHAEMFAPYVQKIMETTTELEGVTLKAPPEIADNWRDGH